MTTRQENMKFLPSFFPCGPSETAVDQVKGGEGKYLFEPDPDSQLQPDLSGKMSMDWPIVLICLDLLDR